MTETRIACLRPSWRTLESVFESPERFFVASPWISTEGAAFLARLRDSKPGIPWEVWTRLDALDFVAGYSDYKSLLEVVEGVEKRKLSLRAAGNLHMKVFWNGTDRALVGSCNLTGGGFVSNLEVAVLLQGPLPDLVKVLDEYRSKAPEISLMDLQAFVKGLNSVHAIKDKWESLRREIDDIMQLQSKRKRREPPYFGLR